MSSTRSNGNLAELREEKIRLRAYELFQKRGGEHGRALDDWLQAEAEFLQQSNRAPAPRPNSTRAARSRKASN
jgi:hypothetical protein